MSVSGEHSVDRVLSLLVRGLVREADAALARIWLIRPGDRCAICRMRPECPDQTRCLHLVASDGESRSPSQARWDGLEGNYQRFPIGIRKVGRIAATSEPLLLNDLATNREWAFDQKWIREEDIRGFAGQPLLFRGEVLGVLAVFGRSEMSDHCFAILRTFADQAAAAIANARAFEEIDRLRAKLEQENEYLREEVRGGDYGDIVGSSSALRRLMEQIELVARTDATVLIQGESGTGKELIARAIHEKSARAGRPLVRVNCAAVPRELFESEFFGHVRGAFTGAARDRAGRFALADGGTLFLDEVGEIPIELQSKLLRVLQEGQFEPVGDDRTQSADVRIIAATNRSLDNDSTATRFRPDLYYRLSVFPIQMPPLRERREDIPELALHFLASASKRFGLPPATLKQRHVQELQAYDWPGNIRELQNVVERAVITSQGRDLEFELHAASNVPAITVPTETERIYTEAEMKTFERDNLLRALEATDWKVGGEGGAAKLLGMKPTTLASRMKVMRIARG
jgi:transcriptional regulator with GAF, ATPase, and Fis domain